MLVKFTLPPDGEVYTKELVDTMPGREFTIRYGRKSWTATIKEARLMFPEESPANGVEIVAEIPAELFEAIDDVFPADMLN